MQYEIIVLGATFAAAGIAQKYGDACLIAERSTCAGYEFLNALSFGTDYKNAPLSEEGKMLFKAFESKGAFQGDRICLYDCAPLLYKQLADKQVLLNTEIVSVKKTDSGFVCTLHGVSGYKTVTAKQVVDTRVHVETVQSKTLNFSLDVEKEFSGIDGMLAEKWGFERNMVMRCPLEKNASFAEARNKILDAVLQLPEDIKLLSIADCFDYTLPETCETQADGMVYLPSKAYKNPVLAFDAGVLFAGGAL
ncbi:MAG: hypothetical protein IKJ55_03220 [Clostridia bacterium]|nr:hypothetical protein [Clostridia bacterium]